MLILCCDSSGQITNLKLKTKPEIDCATWRLVCPPFRSSIWRMLVLYFLIIISLPVPQQLVTHSSFVCVPGRPLCWRRGGHECQQTWHVSVPLSYETLLHKPMLLPWSYRTQSRLFAGLYIRRDVPRPSLMRDYKQTSIRWPLTNRPGRLSHAGPSVFLLWQGQQQAALSDIAAGGRIRLY